MTERSEGMPGATPRGIDRARSALRAWAQRRAGSRVGGAGTNVAASVEDTTGGAAARRPDIGFEDRMGTVEFRVAPDAHIVVDGDSCRGCTTRACVSACPANLFVPTSDGGILFNYEQCFECGTCYLVCNTAGAITWRYPEGGHGVVFRRS